LNSDNMETRESNTILNYPYACGDRIDTERNRYIYTPFLGKDFFHYWRQSREETAGNLPKGCSVEEWLESENFFGSGNYKLADLDDEVGTGKSIYAGFITCLTYQEIVAGDTFGSGKIWLERLIKKFEINKRIYSSYKGSKLKAVDSSKFGDMRNYLMSAVLFEAGFSQLEHFPSLNAFLKIMDSICSQCHQLDHQEKRVLKTLIQIEHEIISKLASKNLINIEN